jgi:hypothetical protein
MARILWWWMLRFMRLPAIRRARRWWMDRIPASTARRMIRQDRFARRYGERVLAFSMALLLASMAITGCYFLALAFVNSGLASPGR